MWGGGGPQNFRTEIHQITALRLKRKSRAKQHTGWIVFEREYGPLYRDFHSRIAKMDLKLTKQEFRICAMIFLSLSSLDIGDKLSISEDTVNNHRSNIRRKLGLCDKHRHDLASLLMKF
jgi:DNA-binding CsgD family transcriptional regulator